MNPTAASTLNLRFERLWRGLGLFGLLAGLALSLLPIPPPPIELAYADKWQHLVGLALMMLYAGMLFPRQRLRAGLGLLLYGLGIELLQSLLPWRSAEWLDLLADASAVVATGCPVGQDSHAAPKLSRAVGRDLRGPPPRLINTPAIPLGQPSPRHWLPPLCPG